MVRQVFGAEDVAGGPFCQGQGSHSGEQGISGRPCLRLPIPSIDAVGFIAVFTAASNTPLASIMMGVELFGSGYIGPLAVTCALAYILVGHRGIYGGHRVHTSKERHP